MPVEVTNALSPVMQDVADCRDLVRKCESDVEEKKTALKLAKAALEEAQGGLNLAVDAAINAERQPTLFDPLGRDTPPPSEEGSGDGGGPPSDGPTPPASGGGSVIVAEFTVNPPEVMGLPVAVEARALPAHEADAGSADDGEVSPTKAKGKRSKKGAA